MHLAALTPALWFGGLLAFNQLGANPIQTLEQRSCDICPYPVADHLACTPARLISGYCALSNRLRRTLGLTLLAMQPFIYSYLLDWITALWWAELWAILQQKTYIWFGLSGFLILALWPISSSIFGKRN